VNANVQLKEVLFPVQEIPKVRTAREFFGEWKKPLAINLPQILPGLHKDFFPGRSKEVRLKLLGIHNRAVERMLRAETIPWEPYGWSKEDLRLLEHILLRSLRNWNLVGMQGHQIGLPWSIIVVEVRTPRRPQGLALGRERLRLSLSPIRKSFSGPARRRFMRNSAVPSKELKYSENGTCILA